MYRREEPEELASQRKEEQIVRAMMKEVLDELKALREEVRMLREAREWKAVPMSPQTVPAISVQPFVPIGVPHIQPGNYGLVCTCPQCTDIYTVVGSRLTSITSGSGTPAPATTFDVTS